MTASSTPVGTVLMYAGSSDGSSIVNLMMAGWIICDGSSYSNIQFPDLFSAIGESYGGSAGHFAVPSYHGMFLRGVSATSHNDPDADTRTAPQPLMANQGNTGNNVGSIQMDQLGAHTHGFVYPNTYYEASHCSGHTVLSGQGTGTMAAAHGPNGKETRPVNQYVNFIIKSVTTPDVVPIGVVMPFAGNLSKSESSLLAAGWLPCMGTKQTVADYNSLYQVIHSYYGADDQSSFYLPDYRGMFLRGVQGSGQTVPMDPDNLTRIAPTKRKYPGNSGNAVGSIQGTDFVSHDHTFTRSGTDNWDTAAALGGGPAWDGGSQNRTSTGVTPAVAESRPVNINTNFIIKART